MHDAASDRTCRDFMKRMSSRYFVTSAGALAHRAMLLDTAARVVRTGTLPNGTAVTPGVCQRFTTALGPRGPTGGSAQRWSRVKFSFVNVRHQEAA
jgi:hypothetical protein